MERRAFVKKSLALGTMGGALSLATPAVNVIAKKKKFRWRLVMAIPKTLPIWGSGVERFAERVEKMSGGDLSIRVYGAGELVPALGTLDAVSAGRVQMGHSASYYWAGKIPAAVFFTAVPFGLNAIGMKAWLKAGGGQQLWDEVYAPHGIRAFPAGNTGMQMGGWFKKEIKTMDDFKGLKMRIPGLGGQVVAKAGGATVLVPGGEIYTNLATGVLDAAEWVGPYHDYVMGLHKTANYYYTPGWQEPGPVLELMVNLKAWQELPDDLKMLVETCAAELDRDMYAEWLAKDAEYLEKIQKETKVQVLNFPPDVLSALKKLSQEAQEEMAKANPLAKKVLDSFLSFKSRFDALQNVTERAYAKADQ
ncbi:MAG: TRAP transporter substrate-binding protein [Oligoflexus sp.]